MLLTHRYYDPTFGRFVTRDPIGYSGGTNLYSLANYNPVNYSDPDGFWAPKGPSPRPGFGIDWAKVGAAINRFEKKSDEYSRRATENLANSNADIPGVAATYTNLHNPGRYPQVNKPDSDADTLAKELGGKSRVKIPGFGDREFDAVSDDYVAQTTSSPNAASNATNYLKQGRRRQIEDTILAAKQEGKTALFDFRAGKPAADVEKSIRKYAERHAVPYRITYL